MVRTIRFLAAAVITLTAIHSLPAQGGPPTTGSEIFTRMRSTYGDSWYKTLTFVQTTTLKTRDGRDTVQTWYESLRFTPELGTRLRIDIAPLSAGNASISSWDSTWVIRGDTLAATRGSGNPFLPFIEGAYLQSAERTAKEVAPLGIDLSKVRATSWDGQPVWVVGSTDASDTTSAQFWVETKGMMVVRIVLAGTQGRPPLDIRLAAMARCGKGWLATRVEMFAGGARRQLEEYHDWKCDVAVDPLLFDASKSKVARHWAK